MPQPDIGCRRKAAVECLPQQRDAMFFRQLAEFLSDTRIGRSIIDDDHPRPAWKVSQYGFQTGARDIDFVVDGNDHVDGPLSQSAMSLPSYRPRRYREQRDWR